MIINNAVFDESLVGNNDLLIMCLGYEPRSCALLKKIKERLPKKNILCFYFDEYNHNSETEDIFNEIHNHAKLEKCYYDDYAKVEKLIQEAIKNMDYETIHIDYSSMPRSWYCRIPKIIEKLITDKQRSYFWYCKGTYPESYKEYPNAGYEDITMFAGKNSFVTSASRTHVIGVGFDTFRTEAILNELDPSHFVICMACDINDEEFKENLNVINGSIIPQAEMTASFNIANFKEMYAGIKELGSSLLYSGDVIFVPDGPKPLIMAMSLAAQNIDAVGLTCLHIHRNNDQYIPVAVTYEGGNIWGFEIKNDVTALNT